MKVLVFALANEDTLLTRLRKRFPQIGFKKSKKNADLEGEGRQIIAFDTFSGIRKVMLIEDVKAARFGSHVEGHDLIVMLRVLLQLGAIDSAKVIAVPEGYDEDKAFSEITSILSFLNSRSDDIHL